MEDNKELEKLARQEKRKQYQKDFKKEYKKTIKQLCIEFYPSDKDIENRLAEVLANNEPKVTYIKRLIREDIERNKKLL